MLLLLEGAARPADAVAVAGVDVGDASASCAAAVAARGTCGSVPFEAVVAVREEAVLSVARGHPVLGWSTAWVTPRTLLRCLLCLFRSPLMLLLMLLEGVNYLKLLMSQIVPWSSVVDRCFPCFVFSAPPHATLASSHPVRDATNHQNPVLACW